MADRARPSAGARLLSALKTMLSFKASYDTTGSWNFGLDLAGARGGGADTGVLETDLAKVADARVGVAAGLHVLDNGFFRSRWDRATRAEQEYLRAMAVDGGAPAATGELASRLGRTQPSLGPARASLIGKGLIYAPEHGVVAFTVPRMADFIARQSEE